MELEGPAELTVGILDCFGGKSISLRPGPQTAVITQSCPNLPPYQPSGQPYSYKLTRFLSENTEPNVSVEDLGYKQIQEFKGRGVRITWRGTEKDGAWNGKPAKVWEEWMSDDLGVTLLWVYSDLTKGIENRATLRGIRREEPDASLFTVPSGYKIDYWK